MGARKSKTTMTFFKKLTSMELAGGMVAVMALVALAFVFSCQPTAGVKPSPGEPAMSAEPEVKEPAAPTLSNKNCGFCHPEQPKIIEEKGGLHKTEVGCMDCHVEHPPQGVQAVPECSMCHSGSAHYELEDCSSCHVDTHAPLDLKLAGSLTGPCLTCHQAQGDELKAHPSMHAELPCNECHLSHREIPSCMDCHVKHSEEMDYQACVTCHPVHMPTVVTYPQDIPSGYCAACHGEAMELLTNNPTKHRELSCAYCHQEKHMMVPPCSQCHPQAHPAAILDKFPTCGHCHGAAHDLKG
jgi:hypothetical protein